MSEARKDYARILKERCPCDICPFTARCRESYLACKAFYGYTVAHGSWRMMARRPSRAWYYRAFPKCDEPLNR